MACSITRCQEWMDSSITTMEDIEVDIIEAEVVITREVEEDQEI